uniref:Transposon protein, putative, unclassified n=1 Tax=Oryza sativa subsp. japonica TaxID=39947 RepID=Q2QS33_ORYSJ|nr:transposon protein, putative, unclassified [Oryza sativa Japonica Group]
MWGAHGGRLSRLRPRLRPREGYSDLKGDNYEEWKRELDLAFILGEVDWVLTTPCHIEPAELDRGEKESDAEWQKRERDHVPLILSYDIEHAKWSLANKNCLAEVKNTIEPTILGSIPECDTVSEYLKRICQLATIAVCDFECAWPQNLCDRVRSFPFGSVGSMASEPYTRKKNVSLLEVVGVYYAVCPLDLSIALRVRNRGEADLDSQPDAVILEIGTDELGAIVCYDTVGQSEPAEYPSDEFDGVVGLDFPRGYRFNPLGEFVDRHE